MLFGLLCLQFATQRDFFFLSSPGEHTLCNGSRDFDFCMLHRVTTVPLSAQLRWHWASTRGSYTIHFRLSTVGGPCIVGSNVEGPGKSTQNVYSVFKLFRRLHRDRMLIDAILSIFSGSRFLFLQTGSLKL